MKLMKQLAPPAIAVAILACAHQPAPSSESTAVPTKPGVTSSAFTLKVLLYPWIPDVAGDDHASLEKRLVEDFQRANPHVTLQVRMVRDWESAEYVDMYDVRKLGQALQEFHAAEIDFVTLAELVARQQVLQVGQSIAPDATAAEAAVTIGGVRYGYPTLACTEFVHTDIDAFSATTGLGWLDALRATGVQRDVAMDLKGSYTVAGLYAQALLDGSNTGTIPSSWTDAGKDGVPLDGAAVDSLRRLREACTVNGEAPCRDQWNDGVLDEQAFAKGEADAHVGYSEALHDIRKANGRRASLHVPLRLGVGDRNLVYADGLVRSAATCASPECERAFDAFARWYTSLRVRALIAFSEDQGADAVPRYVLPARSDFYTTGRAAKDPDYRQFAVAVVNGVPYVAPALTDDAVRDGLKAKISAAIDE